MPSFYSFLLLGCFLATSVFSSAQTDSLIFPQNWEGIWRGELIISTTIGEAQRLPMILKILPQADGRHTYSIVYGEDTEENTRPYYLQSVTDEPGRYQVDEGNGIVLDSYLINGKLYSRFEVMGSLLLSTVEEQDGQLVYEIISGSFDPVNTTGDTKIEDEDIPPVNSYAIRVQQRAVLTKDY